MRDLTKQYDVLLITDEIVTGFGRTGRMFACDQEDVVPDILCLGKSITGGYLPLSAAITHPEIYNSFLGDAATGRSFLHGHTYGGNQLACAAALATIELLEEGQVVEQVSTRAGELANLLARLEALPHVSETRQQGMIAAVELTCTPNEIQPYPAEARVAARICKQALDRGVWIRPLRDTLVIMPPLSITTDELEFLGEVLLESIQVVTDELSALAPST